MKMHNTHTSEEDFCLFCSLLYKRHLVTGVGGNLSIRVGDRIFMTPTGYSLRNLTPNRLVTVNKKGRVLGKGIPTKDMDLHLGILGKRPEINVVCHVHGAFIISASALMDPGHDTLPPVTPGFVYFAYPLKMISFAVPGTKEFVNAAVEHFVNPESRALLLQNHGLVTVAENFDTALNIAEEIDEAARVYVLTNGRAQCVPVEDVSNIRSNRI
ncbi:MAG: class II aldolase/adducin family protein [Thermodesulfobacteriota bacterium]|nr:class II aldolase/adducin family protein [Thermodesulfobacteriota bacterium]